MSSRPTDETAGSAKLSQAAGQPAGGASGGSEQLLELREEELVAHKELRDVGEVEIRTEIDEVPAQLEVDAFREDVEVEHEPVGQVVTERVEPWEEAGALVVPIYEERLVVTKRLVLRERLRIRRTGSTERQLFQDTLRRERLVIEDPQDTGLVHERHASGDQAQAEPDSEQAQAAEQGEHEGGLLEHLVRKALE